MRQHLIGITVVLFIIPLASCGPIYDHQTWTIAVSTSSDSFKAVLPDGRVFYDSASYHAEIPGIVQQMSRQGYVVQVTDQDQSGSVSSPLTSSDFSSQQSALVLYRDSQVVISADFKTAQLNGCFNGRTLQHLSVRMNTNVKGNGQQIYDYHYAVWYENGRKCGGLYESVKQVINYCSCNDETWAQRITQEMKIRLYAAGIASFAVLLYENYVSPMLEGLVNLAAEFG